MKKIFQGFLILMVFFCVQRGYSQQTVSTPEFRREFLEDINHLRKQGCNCGGTFMVPAPPLVWNNYLEQAAIGHAADMAARNYFSHTSKDGRTMEDRIVLAGYTFKGFKSFAIGENIAQGQLSIAEVMQGWIKSPGHCKNLMNPSFREVGVAFNNSYWVQDFGLREPFSPEVQKLIQSGKYKLIEKN
jgi:uncharacterized protein YkwD